MERTFKPEEKLYKMMREHQAKGTCSHTFGALDTVQAQGMAWVEGRCR